MGILPNGAFYDPIVAQPQDWVEDFAGTLRRVLVVFDLPWDPACERFYEPQGRCARSTAALAGGLAQPLLTAGTRTGGRVALKATNHPIGRGEKIGESDTSPGTIG